MPRHSKSKRTSAPPPPGVHAAPMPPPPPVVHAAPTPPPATGIHADLVAPRPGLQPFPSPAMAPAFGPGGWCFPPPALPMASSPAPWWVPGMQQPTTPGTSPNHASVVNNLEEPDLQAWGVDSHPPSGLLNFLKQNTASPVQSVSNGSPSQPISVEDDNTGENCDRSEKRLLWTKEEDLRLVSAWLNNSNDPIQANYKKNNQYWKGVTDVFNSTTPKSRVRSIKQIKDHFARIKKRVGWFCGSWKEANALWASGESDVELMDRAMKSYEEDHKKDDPFMYKHCWDVLRKEPKWDAYLERLEDLEPNKRKFSTEEDVGQHFSLDDAGDKRPPGGRRTKDHNKRKKIDQSCIIDLEDGLNKFVDAQNKATEGRKEILETQKKVSTDNLEAKKFAHLANKEQKETVLLETYKELLMQDTTKMSEDVRSEHVLAIRLLREKLSNN